MEISVHFIVYPWSNHHIIDILFAKESSIELGTVPVFVFVMAMKVTKKVAARWA